MMKIKRILIISLLFSMIISGCNSKKSNADVDQNDAQEEEIVDTHSNDGRTVVGISMPDMLLERWNRDGSFLKTQFENDGCEVILRFANNLIDTQANDLRYMIKNGADLLVITAVDGAALSGVLDEAAKANIKIIAYDRLLMDSDAVDYYVSFDNYQVGVLQANYVIDALQLNSTQKTFNIEFVSGDPVDNNARFFYGGAMDTLQPYIDAGTLQVLSNQTSFYETSTSQWSTDLAQQRLQIILNSYYPKGTIIDAVLCANDSTALGAARALEADYAEKNPVVITGQDGDIANIYNILNGVQSMTVFKAMDKESVVTADLGLAILAGKKPNSDLIDASNWDFDCDYNTTDYNNGVRTVSAYLLKPITITIDNIEEELFDTGYYSRNTSGLIYAVE